MESLHFGSAEAVSENRISLMFYTEGSRFKRSGPLQGLDEVGGQNLPTRFEAKILV